MVSKDVLKQYRYILMENPDLERRIKKTREDLERIESSGCVVDTVKGGSGGIQHFKIEGFPMGDYTKTKTRLYMQLARYEKNIHVLDEIMEDVELFIDSLEDSCTRLIFRYYYEDGMSQEQIARKVNMDQSVVSRRIKQELDKLA